ncbi:IS4/Tn5 family transposase DNA-binding protein [Gemmobacter lanyuensis]
MGQSWVETETAGCDLGDERLNRKREAEAVQGL